MCICICPYIFEYAYTRDYQHNAQMFHIRLVPYIPQATVKYFVRLRNNTKLKEMQGNQS